MTVRILLFAFLLVLCSAGHLHGTFFPDRLQYLAGNDDVARMLSEISVMNNVLFGIDGKQART